MLQPVDQVTKRLLPDVPFMHLCVDLTSAVPIILPTSSTQTVEQNLNFHRDIASSNSWEIANLIRQLASYHTRSNSEHKIQAPSTLPTGLTLNSATGSKPGQLSITKPLLLYLLAQAWIFWKSLHVWGTAKFGCQSESTGLKGCRLALWVIGVKSLWHIMTCFVRHDILFAGWRRLTCRR
jgi:hypothetical protein